MRDKILLVEDSPTQAEALRSHLEGSGYEITLAERGEEALAWLARARFSLVLSDVVMPGAVDGYELCRRIKAAEQADTPVILLTSLSDPLDIIRGLECGADNFLTKPYEPAVLLERIDLLLRNRRLRAGDGIRTGVKVLFKGREYVINSDREQILDLLITTFDEAVEQNRQLRLREEQLSRAQADLERYARSLEAQVARILASVPDVVFSVSPDWRSVHYVSPAARSIFGCEPEAFTLEYWQSRVAAPDRSRVAEEVLESVRSRTPRTFEYRFAQNGSPPRWISQSVIPVGDNGISRLDGIARDVTAHRTAESRLRRMVEAGIVGVIFWDLDGNILDANDEFLRTVGFSREDLAAGRIRWSDMTPPEWRARDREALAQLAATGRCDSFRKEYIRKDGSRVPILVGAATFESPASQGVAFVLDLSEQVQVENGLRDSEERVRLLLESTAEGIYGLDLEGRCTFCNPAAARLLGYHDPADFLGQRMHDLVHHGGMDGGQHPADECPIHRPIKDGEGAHMVDEVMWRADGTPVPVECWSYPIHRDGAIVGSVVTFVDTTERKDLEAQMRQAQKLEAVGQLAGGVAHDFNNMLTVILGESELAAMEPGLSSEVKRSLDAIRQVGTRAKLLTSQLLAFSRRAVVERTVLDLNYLVRDMESMLRRLIGEDVQLVSRPAPDLGAVHADRSQLEQVLMNLVVNARDAMPKGGILAIETANVTLASEYSDVHPEVTPGNYVLLAVSDSGTGMSREVMAHLFEPFFTTKSKERGTGLGLATSYGIVKQSGGHISVYSEPGVGTTMKVYLPRVGEVTPAPLSETADSLPGTETVLLVEDDEAVRATTARLLRMLGYQVLEAGDAASAREITSAAGQAIDLLLCDVVLPETNGRELAAEIRAARPGIRVLFTSGYTDDVILHRKLLAHDAVLIQKPFTKAALATRIRAVLEDPAG